MSDEVYGLIPEDLQDRNRIRDAIRYTSYDNKTMYDEKNITVINTCCDAGKTLLY